MAFRDIRMPRRICEQFSGGPTFATSLVRARSGYVKGNVDRPDPLFVYDCTNFLVSSQLRIDLTAFYLALRGQGYTFRFRDMAHYWTGCVDYPGTGAVVPLAPADIQAFATGDGAETEYQLYVPYIFGGYVTPRKITKPCKWGAADTAGDNPGYTGPTFFVNNVELSASAWELDTATGIVTFDTAPPDGHSIKWAGLFDVHGRWAEDEMVIALLESPEPGTQKLRVIEEL